MTSPRVSYTDPASTIVAPCTASASATAASIGRVRLSLRRRRTSPCLHPSAVRPEDADQFLTGEQAEALAQNAPPAYRRRPPSASGSASSGSDWPKGKAPSPRSGRRHTGMSHEAVFRAGTTGHVRRILPARATGRRRGPRAPRLAPAPNARDDRGDRSCRSPAARRRSTRSHARER
jgi:hypothetical protein